MAYLAAKIYFDGSHYLGIPAENFKRKQLRRRHVKLVGKAKENREKFEEVYQESQTLPKHERKGFVKEKMKESFATEKETNQFLEQNYERIARNNIVRRVRLFRKMNLQPWDYFCTFTYSDALMTEDEFRTKLTNTFKHLVARKGWKYIGVWERAPETNRLHFHGVFFIPQMIGKLEEVKDYSTKNQRMQKTLQNSHFLKQFGRNDFERIYTADDVAHSMNYMMKYMEKSGEKLVYGGKLPTYFQSDILDEDILCPCGIDGKKFILSDRFSCWKEGEFMGTVSPETIEKMPKCN